MNRSKPNCYHFSLFLRNSYSFRTIKVGKSLTLNQNKWSKFMAWKQVKDTQELLRVFMIMFEQFSSYVCALKL